MPNSDAMADAYHALIHDVKNSLGLMTSELDAIAAQLPESERELLQRVYRLSLESARMNNVLMNILGLQREDAGRLAVNIQEAMVEDVLEDVVARYQRMAQQMGVTLTMDCDPDLVWFFDVMQVESILNNVVTNAIRYTKSAIELSAWVEVYEGNEMLHLCVTDDGGGYPQALIDGVNGPAAIDLSTGSTGLGLYLSDKVAAMHEKGGVLGDIALSNDGGAHFILRLP